MDEGKLVFCVARYFCEKPLGCFSITVDRLCVGLV